MAQLRLQGVVLTGLQLGKEDVRGVCRFRIPQRAQLWYRARIRVLARPGDFL